YTNCFKQIKVTCKYNRIPVYSWQRATGRKGNGFDQATKYFDAYFHKKTTPKGGFTFCYSN
ncbi:MAG TPA: hypothetical protein PLP34_01555, partial [Chitinophagaceae bacterium]|nr:hypothetical protein [Chitinophagaceae bacterium]